MVLFASAVSCTATSRDTIPQQQQTLFITPADPTAGEFAAVGATASKPHSTSAFTAAAVTATATLLGSLNTTTITADGGVKDRDREVHKLPLAPGEYVLEAMWQPLPSTLGVQQPAATAAATATGATAGLSSAAMALLQETQQVWLRTQNESLLALRTTHRVLICTNKLEVLNSHVYCTGFKATGSNENDVGGGGVAGTDGLLSGFLQKLLSPQQSKVIRSTAAKDSTGPAARVTDAVTGLSWVGAAVVYTSESGAVRFLLPAPCVLNKAMTGSLSSPAAVPIFRSLGQRMLRRPVPAYNNNTRSAKASGPRLLGSNDTDGGLLCTLPRNISTTLPGSHRVIAVLSDRALVSYLRRDDAYHSVTAVHQVAFTQRPLNPLEPLILGLIALDHMRAHQQSVRAPLVQVVRHCSDVVSALMTYYVSPRAESTTAAAAGGGALPSAQCSRLLSLAVTQYHAQQRTSPVTAPAAAAISSSGGVGGGVGGGDGKSADPNPHLSRAAALAVGLHSQQSRAANCGEFPAVRWVPSGMKFHVATQCGLLRIAAMEALSSRPELQELLLDADSYAGNAVPHMHRSLSTQLGAAALYFLAIAARSAAGKSFTKAANCYIFVSL